MKTIKLSCGLGLLLTLAIAIFLGSTIFFAVSWLYTYRVFTDETVVAEIQVSELKIDENGEYFDITINQIKGRSPLAAVFNPYDETDDNLTSPETFKLYGDTFEVGGPIVNFSNFLQFFNFDLVYKIAFVRGEYSLEAVENMRTENMPSRYDLNGGFETWRNVQEDIQNNTFRGEILDIFIEQLPEISSKGRFVTNEPQNYTLCVTEENFVLCDTEESSIE